ncbi:McrC family protein [Pseudomonas sp. FP1740]|uniref:McrC family protein n=1 Tax=Pseudomonas sp. FP1740 TaxID=2954078 RepID=UPI002733EBB6|nr:McrC family protein [Pseudomonas sp. FP1740]WLG45724.1 McrC family protein [Pseudomonas sp. FP1740]
MSTNVIVREYARLTTAPVPPGNLDCAHISETAFDWLCDLSASFNRAGATLLQVEGRQSLKWDSYVGVIETPCGTRLEILPKHFEQGDCVLKSRTLLRKLIQAALFLKPRQVSVTALELFDAPLTEWVIGQYLNELDALVKRGIRFDYTRVEEERPFLRGQLNVVAQLRQPPGRQHQFQVRHDVYLPDRAENRLLKLALEQVAKVTQLPANWRLANELRALLAEIPASRHVAQDFRLWSRDRLMAHYGAIRPWCELVLNQQMPVAVQGTWQGVSLLFPMERLFENYVQQSLGKQLRPGVELTAQTSQADLCRHGDRGIFRLRPDLLMDTAEQRWVLDTKWKRIDQRNAEQNYNLSQSDFYQLFAYGHKYRNGGRVPRLVLIYPYWAGLQRALPVFDYGDGLQLWALPFDLEGECLLDAEVAGVPLEGETRGTVRG